MTKKAVYILLLYLAFFACVQKDYNPPFIFTEIWPETVPQPETNIATIKGVALGQKLFSDPFLSENGKISCATCHQPDKAFSDGKALSDRGASGSVLLRHAPVLFNLAWMDGFFWDGGAKNLESQVFGPLSHPDEMGNDLAGLIDRLNRHSEYPALFKAAFGTDTISSQQLSRAFAQFERSLLSFGSRYDRWKKGKDRMSNKELEGYRVYKSKCAACHTEGLFTDNLYHNNGLDSSYTDTRNELLYYGRYRITSDSADIGKYKTASLRNLAFSAPYMHDGRFATLNEVLDHYSAGVKNYPSLSEKLRPEGRIPGIALSSEEKESLLLFLNTLNDSSFISRQYF
jgi:cytochrome c peroxidase